MASTPSVALVSVEAPTSNPLRVEYSAAALEEVRALVVEGFYRLTRGGVEVCGLLLGAVSPTALQPQTLQILAQQPFEIEYAYGPSLRLSPRDLESLRDRLNALAGASPAPSPESEPTRVLGLYLSHTRASLAPTEAEIALFAEFFPHPWQTLLILKPSRAAETAAAFHFRNHQGEMLPTQALEPFDLAPVMRERRRPREESPESPSLNALAAAAGQSAGAPTVARSTAAPRATHSAPSVAPAPSPQKAATHSPAPIRLASGRVLWTGQLQQNDTVEIQGNEANRGMVNMPLPGYPIRVQALSAEFSNGGLLIRSANPRYRKASRAVEAPGPANDWHPTQYRFDPDAAVSLAVLATPDPGNGWQGISIRNEGNDTNIVVIDWQALA